LADFFWRWLFTGEVKMTDSQRLLADYLKGSEPAFREPNVSLNAKTRLLRFNHSRAFVGATFFDAGAKLFVDFPDVLDGFQFQPGRFFVVAHE
jgi:hypothetical protein